MKWISVEDRFPESGEWVLVYMPKKKSVHYLCYRGIECWVTPLYLEPSETPTHWMPLPEPPESEDK